MMTNDVCWNVVDIANNTISLTTVNIVLQMIPNGGQTYKIFFTKRSLETTKLFLAWLDLGKYSF